MLQGKQHCRASRYSIPISYQAEWREDVEWEILSHWTKCIWESQRAYNIICGLSLAEVKGLQERIGRHLLQDKFVETGPEDYRRSLWDGGRVLLCVPALDGYAQSSLYNCSLCLPLRTTASWRQHTDFWACQQDIVIIIWMVHLRARDIDRWGGHADPHRVRVWLIAIETDTLVLHLGQDGILFHPFNLNRRPVWQSGIMGRDDKIQWMVSCISALLPCV